MTGARKPNSDKREFDPSEFVKVVRAHRTLLIRLASSEFAEFEERVYFARPFTMAVARGLLDETRVPTLCFVFGSDDFIYRDRGSKHLRGHMGIFARKGRFTSIDDRIKVIHSLRIDPETLDGFAELVTDKRGKRTLTDRLSNDGNVISLPPELSVQLVRALAARESNLAVFSRLAVDLRPSRDRSTFHQLQADAIATALEIFGLRTDVTASKLKVSAARKSALSEYWLREDTVVQQDARSIPEFELTESDVTGRALFRREHEVLEVITANRLPLERVLGVDLIYHNVVRRSLVMVQYKMLDPAPSKGALPDWVYRPERNLLTEMRRMKLIAKRFPPSRGGYRLNAQMFYLKFVRRDQIGTRAAITLPLEHFEKIPKTLGARGARRVSYRALNGAYLRDEAFFGLVRAGYIGSYSKTTALLLPVIKALVAAKRAVVIAIQKELQLGK